MKKHFTYVAVNKVFNTLPAKIFFLVFMLFAKSFESHATTWTTATAGDVTNLANWTNGATSPTSFTTPGDTWTINLAMTQSSSSTSWIVGTISSTAAIVTFDVGGTLSMSGAGTTYIDTIYGNVVVSGGTFTLGGAGTAANVYVYGNYTVSSGTVSSTGAGSDFITNIYGNYSMTGGTYSSAGSTTLINNNIYGNCSYSGACSMTCTGAGAISTVHLSLPTYSGTMLADNTSTGAAWSKTNIYIDAGCTAQLDGNFSVATSGPSLSTAGSFGVNVNGTLICPAAYDMYGTGAFIVNPGATLEVANAAGINGAVTGTGTRTFNTAANYVFNGSVAQVTGTYLPASLVTPDTITISNSAGVTLTNPTSTTGTLLFTSGILYTGAGATMTTPGTAGAVVGAGATSYVDGTLVKTITGLTSVNFEVGDLDYAPMNLALSAAGTGGMLGVMTTNGLHPLVGTSGIMSTNIANHYWTITNYSASGPATVTPKATYNLSDILGGSNSTFVTQEYTSAWLPSSIASTNTVTPYTTVPNTGIALGTIAGDFIFGSDCTTAAITGMPALCTGSSTILSDATASGVWSSNNTNVATVSAGGTVYGVAAGSATISYMVGCPATVVVTVGTLPITGGATSMCPGSSVILSDGTPGGVWSSSNTLVATVSPTGTVYGVTTGSANILYTAGSCAPVSMAVFVVTIAAVTPSTATICAGSTVALSDAAGGGVWTSSNNTIATVDASGMVTGASAGTTTIVYTTGSCTASATVTVSGTLSPITGTAAACIGSTTALSDATPGGVWSSSNTGVATVNGLGVVYGNASGTTIISYTTGSCAVGISVTVGVLPAITGPTSVCAGSTITLSDTAPSGVWSSGSPGAATISGTGVVYGVASGSTTISYTVGSCSSILLVTVGSAIAAITGNTTVCTGNSTALSDATTGGVWSSGNNAVATVSGSVLVYGVSPGTATISYTIGGCSASILVTVNAGSAGVISGKDSVCPGGGHVITLSDNIAGGVWSSSSTSRATVDPVTGVVGGVSSGTTTIRYVVSSSCGTYTATYVVHVRTPAQCATGVDPAEAQIATLKVFPNPNKGVFTINLSSDIDEEVHVVITNIVGEKMKEITTMTNKATEIKLDPAAGIYLLSVSTRHGRYMAKVVVN